MAAVAALALTILSVLAIAWMGQRRLMYFPSDALLSPVEAGVSGAEAVTFPTADGLTLGGWFVPAAGPLPRVTLLVFNGNAGNRSYRGPLAAALRAHGLQVLLFDYRGYGGNAGTPSEEGLAADSRAARAYLAGRDDVDVSRLVYFGESLGTAVAVDLAVEHPPAALVLRSPFTSMVDVGRYHYPFLPVGLLLRDRFAAIDRVARLGVPMLVVAGGRDAIVPIENSRRLYEAAAGPKRLLVLPEADHNDHELLAGEEMIRAVARFVQPLGSP
jgi:fermentation-respiration switch protein FrsA (DUF1100 family)